jgi:hypothetical protein
MKIKDGNKIYYKDDIEEILKGEDCLLKRALEKQKEKNSGKAEITFIVITKENQILINSKQLKGKTGFIYVDKDAMYKFYEEVAREAI